MSRIAMECGSEVRDEWSGIMAQACGLMHATAVNVQEADQLRRAVQDLYQWRSGLLCWQW